jgi:hypothetical protein
MLNENAGVVLKSGHSSMTSMCRTPGFKTTDRYGDQGVVCEVKEVKRPGGMSLTQLFNLSPEDTSQDNEPQKG